MADFKIDVPININGGKSKGSSSSIPQKESKYEKQMINQQKFMTTNLKGILIATGAVAIIWKALAPVLNPLLKLLSLVLLVIFLPLLPKMKEIANKIGDLIKNIRTGQKQTDGTESFTGGISAFFGDMTGVGLAIGAAFLLAISTGAGVVGALTLGLGFILAWNTIKGANESSLEEKLKSSMWVGLATGIAALAFGAGIYALPIGLLTFGLTLGLSFLKSAWKEEDVLKAIKDAAAGSLVLGVIAGGVALLLGATGGAAAIVTVAVGGIIFSLWTGLKIGKGVKEKQEELNISGMVEEETTKAQKVWEMFKGWFIGSLTSMVDPIGQIGFMIGSSTKGSYPLVYSLIQAEKEWITMGSVSNNVINGVISNLNRIPRRIVTIHEIRTIRTSGTGAK